MSIFITYRLIPLATEDRSVILEALADGGYYRTTASSNEYVPGVTICHLLGIDWTVTRYYVRRYGDGYALFRRRNGKEERVTLLPVLVFREVKE